MLQRARRILREWPGEALFMFFHTGDQTDVMYHLQYRVTPELKLDVTEHGWDTVSNLVYVDQPINTGFSYSDDPSDAVHDEAKVADDMVQFLAEFVQVRFF